jgi:hypothetical protein
MKLAVQIRLYKNSLLFDKLHGFFSGVKAAWG